MTEFVLFANSFQNVVASTKRVAFTNARLEKKKKLFTFFRFQKSQGTAKSRIQRSRKKYLVLRKSGSYSTWQLSKRPRRTIQIGPSISSQAGIVCGVPRALISEKCPMMRKTQITTFFFVLNTSLLVGFISRKKMVNTERKLFHIQQHFDEILLLEGSDIRHMGER